MRITNPKLTKEAFGREAYKNYYQKGVRPYLYKVGTDIETGKDIYTATSPPPNITPESIVRRVNRLLRAQKKE
jgi:hypothetical protein